MSSDKIIGCVNWFDSKKGYGFITVLTPDSEHKGTDIFVHFSNILVDDNYKRLFPGEYTEFNVDKSPDGRLCCANVGGVHGGKLLVENENHRYKIYPKNIRRDDDAGNDGDDADDADANANADGTDDA
jgi:CspA family cold shock protein